MKVVAPEVYFYEPVDGEDILRHLERCGRVCYKSEGAISVDSAERFVTNIIKRGHEAVLEHASFSVKFLCDRGVSHEVVRHRLAAYCQESTRYCNYSVDKFDNSIAVVKPCFLDVDIPTGEYEFNRTYGQSDWYCNNSKVEIDKTSAAWHWLDAMYYAENYYMDLIMNHGWTPQEARSVLPTSLKTELIMTADVREWRHFLKLRCSTAAHPQMREIANKLLKLCQDNIPVLFDDIVAV